MLRKQLIGFLAVMFVCVTAVIHAAEVTLVRLGKPEAVILLDKKATKSAQMGALELQYHVKLITGAEAEP